MLSHETTCASAGDENFVRRRVNRSYDKKQLTPRQGTKTPRRPCRTQHPSETTYTPPGDENRVGLVPIQDLCEITYIPPGDENAVCGIYKIHKNKETTYAPPGDENSCEMLETPCSSVETTYTPPGDENHRSCN